MRDPAMLSHAANVQLDSHAAPPLSKKHRAITLYLWKGVVYETTAIRRPLELTLHVQCTMKLCEKARLGSELDHIRDLT